MANLICQGMGRKFVLSMLSASESEMTGGAGTTGGEWIPFGAPFPALLG